MWQLYLVENGTMYPVAKFATEKEASYRACDMKIKPCDRIIVKS